MVAAEAEVAVAAAQGAVSEEAAELEEAREQPEQRVSAPVPVEDMVAAQVEDMAAV